MKSKIVVFSIILIFIAIEIQAQPGCRGKFSPYNICQTDYAQADYIFYGEIISSGEMDYSISINSTNAFYKTTVKVEKSIKGETPRQLDIYLHYEIVCDGPPKPGFKHIFNVRKGNLNNNQVFYSQYMSRPLIDYSPLALKEVFSGIRAILQNKKKKSLDGYVFERLENAREVKEKSEESDRYLLSTRFLKPRRNVLVEAVNERNNKVYRTKSNADGAYRFDNLPKGNYKLRAYPNDEKEGEILNITVDDIPCSRWRNVFVRPKSK